VCMHDVIMRGTMISSDVLAYGVTRRSYGDLEDGAAVVLIGK